MFIRGDLRTNGYFFCPNKFFRIDHTLDPTNKYLVHATVESPDRTNLYNGTAVLGEKGEATVRLPQWFDVLNCDCHYQLTCVGGHAPVYVAQEIRDNEFRIAGGHRGLKVCWQVTGRRHDPAARAHPVVTEPEKPPSEKGLYQDPLAHGQSADKRIGFERQRAQAEKAQEFLNRIRASERGAA
ncbi:MAG: hypothetical protein J2P49_10890 [Methylocapsa sp.]|nr:hypothetical protein [Methylocapsa sp.]